MEEEETEDQQFDLIKLYAAKQRRVNKRALVNGKLAFVSLSPKIAPNSCPSREDIDMIVSMKLKR